jgi:hypothetical protein
MEQLTAHLKEQVVISSSQKEQKKTKFLGQIRPQRGQRIYELNVKSLDIIDVTPQGTDVDISGKVNRKLQVREGHIYCVALNEKNAERKFIKRLNELAVKMGLKVQYKKR